MGFNRYPKSKGPRKPLPPDIMEHPKINISRYYDDRLKDINHETRLPVARLIAIAIENEMESANPFQYEIPVIDHIPYKEDQYFEESVKVLNYIFNYWKTGIGYDTLLLCRHDFGIDEKIKVMLGLRKLLVSGQVEEAAKRTLHNPKDYRVLRVTLDQRQYMDEQKQYKKIEPIQKGPL